jgi:replicative DNA helicase
MGKTAWAINIAQRVATYSNRSVGIFSLEMSKEALLRRMLASQSMVDLGNILTGKMPANERENLLSALRGITNTRLRAG